MAESYKKLFQILIDRNMTPELHKEAGYSANIPTRMSRDEMCPLN